LIDKIKGGRMITIEIPVSILWIVCGYLFVQMCLSAAEFYTKVKLYKSKKIKRGETK